MSSTKTGNRRMQFVLSSREKKLIIRFSKILNFKIDPNHEKYAIDFLSSIRIKRGTEKKII
ncbi:hypothetical protein BpHYR1_008627 [Brachionus plicatilis]|uniref:Uncharacterized protein n=1 Tax=Brachionus plicatilis TaxID=10195 RepID=A0A3M7S9G6_BRAPC|nr:hypothetical protein BpHYR1_008627 [Brachionus plicatilis]